MIRKIDSNIFSLTILKVTTFSRIRHHIMPVILLFMGANIRIKYEIALRRVHFLTKIALFSVQFANIYKVVAIKYLEKQI